MLAISAAPAVFIFSTIGIFMNTYAAEFGWSRSQISGCVTLLTASTALTLPIVGYMIDRLGAKRIILISMVLYALCLATIPVFVQQIWQLALMYLLIGIFAIGTTTVTYIRIIATWFDKRRGLAIGIVISGIGLGSAYVPILVQYMISNYGWQSAYYVLASIVILVPLPLIYFVIKETPAMMGLVADGIKAKRAPEISIEKEGVELTDALRSHIFWLLFLIFICISFVLNGVFSHLVPMLTDRGMLAVNAAAAASAVGVTLFIGRILIGYLVDRIFAPYVAMFFFTLSTIGIAILMSGVAGWYAVTASVLIGFSLGAEADLISFLASRYFGLRAFGTIYGLLLSAMMLGIAVSPLMFALSYESTGSYSSILAIAVIVNIAVILMMTLLGPFPNWQKTSIAD
ncbi:MAG: MFS transporter [Gammaproteobacteria bacterium]|nr:MFS transporter [Gammaproteobacteria bacterium]